MDSPMKFSKNILRFNWFATLLSFTSSTSVILLVNQGVNISNKKIFFWIFLFFVLYVFINFLINSNAVRKWGLIDTKKKLLVFLLIPLFGAIILKLTNFSVPNPLFILPKQNILIETSLRNNPLSSGYVTEIKGMVNGDQWVNLETLDVDGNYQLTDDAILIDEHPAQLTIKIQIDNKLMLNFIHRPDGGKIKISGHDFYQEIDLYSEKTIESPVYLDPSYPQSFKLATHFIFITSVGFFFFFIPVVYLFSLIPGLSKRFGLASAESQTNQSPDDISISGLALITVLLLLIFFFMEWLFQITKPSFMNVYDLSKKIIILLSSFSLLAVTGLTLFFVAGIINSALGKHKASNGLIKTLLIIPTCILTIIILLLVDNFTYTIFKVGVVTSSDVTFRFILLLSFLILLLVCYQEVTATTAKISLYLEKRKNITRITAVTIIVIFFITNFILESSIAGLFKHYESDVINTDKLPNIIFITSDGVNANNMSLYGYERETTPFLSTLSGSSLLAENAFTNSGKTTGSILSIFTGKYPSETRVLNPTEILQDSDSYESLTKILKDAGYYNIQIAVPHYIDAYDQNMLGSFDVVNGRSKSETLFSRLFSQNTMYFLDMLKKRVSERIYHIFFIDDMQNVIELVEYEGEDYNDREKIDELLRYIEDADQPIFIHVHLMGTHGTQGRLFPIEQVFSKGKNPESQEKSEWNVDFYDDCIRDFDNFVRLVHEKLVDENKLENSILIIGSDHGQKWTTLDRIPLLIRFPHGEYSGKIKTNVQNIDIAPTILDYLNFDIPDWMEGNSLIEVEKNQIQYPIFSFSSYDRYVEQISTSPPFFQFQFIYVVHSQNWYALDLDDQIFTSGTVNNYVEPCNPEDHLSNEAVFDLMMAHLQEKGFDTSSLANPAN